MHIFACHLSWEIPPSPKYVQILPPRDHEKCEALNWQSKGRTPPDRGYLQSFVREGFIAEVRKPGLRRLVRIWKLSSYWNSQCS